jgi:hypothetical protein
VRALNARLPPGVADIRIEAFRGYRTTIQHNNQFLA